MFTRKTKRGKSGVLVPSSFTDENSMYEFYCTGIAVLTQCIHDSLIHILVSFIKLCVKIGVK